MHERVSGNICPLVSWLQIVFPCSKCLCAIGTKNSFRNGDVSACCRAVGEKGRLFPVAWEQGQSNPESFRRSFQ